MFNKVLIANRGEIAVRVIRACRELGLQTVAVCSDADRTALHAQLADETLCIGPAAGKGSYLNIPAVLRACRRTGAQAVHPGYGFLSENANFVRQCEENGLIFIGPSALAIEKMGDKASAKQTMASAGVPVIPGSDGVVADGERAERLAAEIGFPLLVKASSGGGGRGIRLVERREDLARAISAAQMEAESCFGDSSVYLERFLKNPRHVEIQVLEDADGRAVYLGERDCSMQRRNQKVVEECPSPSHLMNEELHRKMGEAAVKAAQAVNYQGAGTVEFLLDSDGSFYFMEMNTRIQVEHPITEEVTGVDLVKEQLRIAMGKPLSFTQEDVVMRGHAIECRINAENPMKDFQPSPGLIRTSRVPGGPGIRVESAVYAGYKIPPYYDNMLAKLVAYGADRDEAIARMRRALREFVVEGVETNIEFQLNLLDSAEFQSGEYHNGTLALILDGLIENKK